MSMENIFEEIMVIHSEILEQYLLIPRDYYQHQIFRNMLTLKTGLEELQGILIENQTSLNSNHSMAPEDYQVFRGNILSLNTKYKQIMDMLSLVMEEANRSYIPMLASLLNMLPEDVNHSDIIWIRRWLAHPEHSVEDNKNFIIYAARAAGEALATQCHILKDNLEQFVWNLIPLFEAFFKQKDEDFGFVSNRFNTWIIQTVGDPAMCPNSELRLKMLLLYRLLKIDDGNWEQALKSVLSACSFLDRPQESGVAMLSNEVFECLGLFYDIEDLKESYLYQFCLQLRVKLRQNQNIRKQIIIQDIAYEYAMGLKTVVEPREILGLIAILRYISVRTCNDYKAFQEDPNNNIHKSRIDEAVTWLNKFVYPFKPVLGEPEMINVTAECVMNVIEFFIRCTYMQIQEINEYTRDHLWEVNTIFIDLAYKKGTQKIGHGRVGNEIVSRYKERICRLRLDIPKVFMEGESNEYLCDIIYNDKY